jgi:glycosyltransferase involved in cell wall biosynthesis
MGILSRPVHGLSDIFEVELPSNLKKQPSSCANHFNKVTVSVIISTYNQPAWLEKVLWGYEVQLYKEFDIVIADDGSTDETRQLIERFKQHSNLSITHVWQEDNGHQKCKILNKAIQATSSEYLIFTDGDCIPRRDFVEAHVKNAKPNHFLSGGIVRLPIETSQLITQEDIVSGRALDLHWLRQVGLPNRMLKNLKLSLHGRAAAIMNSLTTRKPTWNGCNSSGWRKDMISVNGFDERMTYGGQDVEFGYRLVHSGLKPVQLVYSLAAIHLEHGRAYKTPAALANSLKVRKETLSKRKTKTEYGIIKLSPMA